MKKRDSIALLGKVRPHRIYLEWFALHMRCKQGHIALDVHDVIVDKPMIDTLGSLICENHVFRAGPDPGAVIGTVDHRGEVAFPIQDHHVPGYRPLALTP